MMRAAKDHRYTISMISMQLTLINLKTVATETDLVTYFDKFSDSDVDFVMS